MRMMRYVVISSKEDDCCRLRVSGSRSVAGPLSRKRRVLSIGSINRLPVLARRVNTVERQMP
jgi:hypothetical protein